MPKLSRRKIASYSADWISDKNKSDADLFKDLAAFLIDQRRTHELALLVRDIESQLEQRGVVIARINSASGISQQIENQIEQFIKKRGAKQVIFEKRQDKALLGGLVLDLPSSRLDTTLKNKLNKLSMKKV